MNSDRHKQIILAQLHALLEPRGFRKNQALFSAERYLQLLDDSATT